MNNKYWILIDGEEIGPLSYEDLFKFNLLPNSLIWTPGFEVWHELSNMPWASQYLNQKIERDESTKEKKGQLEELLEKIAINNKKKEMRRCTL